jgi:hypothetical protein
LASRSWVNFSTVFFFSFVALKQSNIGSCGGVWNLPQTVFGLQQSSQTTGTSQMISLLFLTGNKDFQQTFGTAHSVPFFRGYACNCCPILDYGAGTTRHGIHWGTRVEKKNPSKLHL